MIESEEFAVPETVFSSELGEQLILVDVRSGGCWALRSVGRRIFDLVADLGSLRKVREIVSAEFDVPPSEADENVSRLVAELWKAGLLEVACGDSGSRKSRRPVSEDGRGASSPEPVAPEAVLPPVRAFVDGLLDAIVRNEDRAGRPVSCSKGCGACCRQAVPVGLSEACRILSVVEALPDHRRKAVMDRFEANRKQLEQAGLLERALAAFQSASPEEKQRLIVKYLELGMPCPFLEEEACSIYSERPVICRAYLVTSPPEECARLTGGGVRRAPRPVRLMSAMRALDSAGEEPGMFLLSLLPFWLAARDGVRPLKPAEEHLRRFSARLLLPSGSEG